MVGGRASVLLAAGEVLGERLDGPIERIVADSARIIGLLWQGVGSGKGLTASIGNIPVRMASSPRSDDDDSEENESTVPAGVLEGIEDVAEGRTADGDDLDEALDL